MSKTQICFAVNEITSRSEQTTNCCGEVQAARLAVVD